MKLEFASTNEKYKQTIQQHKSYIKGDLSPLIWYE